MHLKMLSAICFNLDQSKILSSGNGLTLYHCLKGTLLVCYRHVLTGGNRVLTLYHTIPTFNDPGDQHFLLFPQCFLPFPKQVLIFYSNLFCCLQMLSILTTLQFCHLVRVDNKKHVLISKFSVCKDLKCTGNFFTLFQTTNIRLFQTERVCRQLVLI